MNLSKSYEFFKPESLDARVHIIGCGSVGSTIAENLARCGVTKMTLYDFDKVEAHNVHNQMFRACDIGKPKVEALKDILTEINPEIGNDLVLRPKGWTGQIVSGIIVLAVDSIELRRQIVEAHMDSVFVRAVFDVRTGLTDAQHFAANWSDPASKHNLLQSMQFSHDEATAETPVSACGVTLGVVTTVRLICALCVNNMIAFAKGEGLKKFIQIDGFSFLLDAFS